MKNFLNLFFLFSLFFCIAKTTYSVEFAIPNGGSPYVDIDSLKEGQIVHVPTGVTVTLEQMIDSISASSVIYISETHDNYESHKVQLEIIKAMYSKHSDNIVIGMEMFRRPAQEEINRWLKGKMSETKFRLLWNDNWGSGYENYSNILKYIKKNKIPVLALKPGKKNELAFRSEGINGHSKSLKVKFPELYENDKYHKIFSNAVFGGHDSKTHSVLKSPYQTLLLWEETMAENIANFLKNRENKSKKIIVLAGSFHIEYGFGVPKRTYRRVPHNYSTVLPIATSISEELKSEVMMEVEPTYIPLYLGDYVWSVKYEKVKYNNVSLGVYLKENDKGLNVLSVVKNSNAMIAGIQPGDTLISLDNHPIIDILTLQSLLKIKSAGEYGNIELMRDKKKININVKFKEE